MMHGQTKSSFSFPFVRFAKAYFNQFLSLPKAM